MDNINDRAQAFADQEAQARAYRLNGAAQLGYDTTGNDELDVHDGDTPYVGTAGYRILGLNTPELGVKSSTEILTGKALDKIKATSDARMRKYDNLYANGKISEKDYQIIKSSNQATQESTSRKVGTKSGGLGEEAAMAGYMTIVNDTGPNILEGTGESISVLDPKTGESIEKKLGEQSSYAQDAYKRNLVANPDYAKYMIDQGYGVAMGQNEQLRDAGRKAMLEGKGLWADPKNANEMEGLYYAGEQFNKPDSDWNMLKGIGASTLNVGAKVGELVGEGIETAGSILGSEGTESAGKRLQKAFNIFQGTGLANEMTGYSGRDQEKFGKDLKKSWDNGDYLDMLGRMVGLDTVEALAVSLPEMVALGAMLPMMVLANINRNINEAEKNKGAELTIGEKAQSAAISTVSTLLDRLGDKLALSGMNPAKTSMRYAISKLDDKAKESLAAKYGAGVLKIGTAPVRLGSSMVVEGGTEYLQTLGETAAQNVDIGRTRGFTDEEYGQATEAMLIGAASGGLMSAPALARDTVGKAAAPIGKYLDNRKAKAESKKVDTGAEQPATTITEEDEVALEKNKEVISNKVADLYGKAVDDKYEITDDDIKEMKYIKASADTYITDDPETVAKIGRIQDKLVSTYRKQLDEGKIELKSKDQLLDLMDSIGYKEGDVQDSKIFELASKAGLLGDVEEEKQNNYAKIVKDFTTVDEEATTGLRGYTTQGRELRAMLDISTPNVAQVKKKVSNMQSFQASQKTYYDKAKAVVTDMTRLIDEYNSKEGDAGSPVKMGLEKQIKDIGAKYSKVPINKAGDKFTVHVKMTADGKLQINPGSLSILEAKKRNIEGITAELTKVATRLEEIGLTGDITSIASKTSVNTEGLKGGVKKAVEATKARIEKTLEAKRGKNGTVKFITMGEEDGYVGALTKNDKEKVNTGSYNEDDVVYIALNTNELDLKELYKELKEGGKLHSQIQAAKKAGARIVLDHGIYSKEANKGRVDSSKKSKQGKTKAKRKNLAQLMREAITLYADKEHAYKMVGQSEDGKTSIKSEFVPVKVYNSSKEKSDVIKKDAAHKEKKLKSAVIEYLLNGRTAEELYKGIVGHERLAEGLQGEFADSTNKDGKETKGLDKLRSYLEGSINKQLDKLTKIYKKKNATDAQIEAVEDEVLKDLGVTGEDTKVKVRIAIGALLDEQAEEDAEVQEQLKGLVGRLRELREEYSDIATTIMEAIENEDEVSKELVKLQEEYQKDYNELLKEFKTDTGIKGDIVKQTVANSLSKNTELLKSIKDKITESENNKEVENELGISMDTIISNKLVFQAESKLTYNSKVTGKDGEVKTYKLTPFDYSVYTQVKSVGLLSEIEADMLVGDEYSYEAMSNWIEGNVKVSKKADKETVIPENIFNLTESPASGLVVDKNGKVNTSVALAMNLALDELIAFNGRMLNSEYKSYEDAALMLGVTENVLHSNPQAYEMVKHRGMFQKTLANKLGASALQKLGIAYKRVDGVEKEAFDKLEADLGNMIILAGMKAGVLADPDAKSKEKLPARVLHEALHGKGSYIGSSNEATVSFVIIAEDADTTEISENYKEIHKLIDDVSTIEKGYSTTAISRGSRRHDRENVSKDIAGLYVPGKEEIKVTNDIINDKSTKEDKQKYIESNLTKGGLDVRTPALKELISKILDKSASDIDNVIKMLTCE